MKLIMKRNDIQNTSSGHDIHQSTYVCLRNATRGKTVGFLNDEYQA